jgi:erythromycin esterase-like protein
MSFKLAKTIFLPSHKKKDNCTVSLNCKTELDSLQLMVMAFDKKENLIFSDSLYINKNDQWADYPITFPLAEAKAIKIKINYSYTGYSDSIRKREILLNQIKIKIDNQLINHYPVSSISGIDKYKNNKSLIPLSPTDETTLSKIKDWKDRKIIALGEFSHGSQDIENAGYQFIKYLIVSENCKAIVIERAFDMCLRWDLYVQGILSESFEEDLLEELKKSFCNYNTHLDFIKWLREYNRSTNNPVHLFGADDNASDPFFLTDHFLKLSSTKEDSLFYWQTIADKEYANLMKHIGRDSALRTILGDNGIDYLRFVVNQFQDGLVDNYDANQRDVNMANRVDKIAQLYPHPQDKIVLYEHSGHIEKGILPLVDNHGFPAGYYLHEKYKQKYFSIAFQAGEGTYSQDSLLIGGVKVEPLRSPPDYAFERFGLNTGLEYFYISSNKLPENMLALSLYPRRMWNSSPFRFCFIPLHFDAIVFIRNSHELSDFGMKSVLDGGYLNERKRQLDSIFKELLPE